MKTSSYNIGIFDAHKCVLRGLCWVEAGLKYLQLLMKLLSYYGKTKIALKLFRGGVGKKKEKCQQTILWQIQQPHQETTQMSLVPTLLM